jgi:hypothetical protein
MPREQRQVLLLKRRLAMMLFLLLSVLRPLVLKST